jgi:hypothetical protein
MAHSVEAIKIGPVLKNAAIIEATKSRTKETMWYPIWAESE